MIKAVLLDFDGVIMPIELVLEGAKKALAEYGIDVSEDFIKEKIIGRRIVDTLPEYFGISVEKSLEIRSRYHEIYKKLALNADPLPGCMELFDFCHKNGIKTGIVSTKARGETEPVIERLGLEPDVTVFQEDVKRYKPDPEPVLLALSRLGVEPRDAVFIGDHVFDIKAGKRAGVKAIGVLTGAGKKEDLIDAGADLIFPSLVEFLGWLKKTK